MKNRSLFALALSVAVTAGSLSAFAAPAAYHDVKPRHWAAKHIEDLTERNVVVGYNDERFRPSALITRQEFANILNQLGSEGRNKAQELMNGGESPNAKLRRVQVLSVLSDLILGEAPTSEKTDMILKNFTDGRRVPSWARQQVAKTIDHDVFKSVYKYQNTVHSNELISRAEVSQMVDRLLITNELAMKPKIEVHHIWEEVVPNKDVVINIPPKPVRSKSTYTVTVATGISSEFNKVGDEVSLILNEHYEVGGLDIPPGSKIVGKIKEIQPAGFDKTAVIGIDMNQLVTPDQKTYQLKASLATPDGFLRGDNAEVIKRVNSSYDGLKAEFKPELGVKQTAPRDGVLAPDKPVANSAYYDILNANKGHFVVVGVGDQLELNLEGVQQ